METIDPFLTLEGLRLVWERNRSEIPDTGDALATPQCSRDGLAGLSCSHVVGPLGPAVLYIVAPTPVHGDAGAPVWYPRSGSRAEVSCTELAAVSGLSALLAASAEAFTVVKLLGADYSSGARDPATLAHCGRPARGGQRGTASVKDRSRWDVPAVGVVVNVALDAGARRPASSPRSCCRRLVDRHESARPARVLGAIFS